MKYIAAARCHRRRLRDPRILMSTRVEAIRTGITAYIVIASPEELLRGIEGHGRYGGGHRVHARGRELNPGDLETTTTSQHMTHNTQRICARGAPGQCHECDLGATSAAASKHGRPPGDGAARMRRWANIPHPNLRPFWQNIHPLRVHSYGKETPRHE